MIIKTVLATNEANQFVIRSQSIKSLSGKHATFDELALVFELTRQAPSSVQEKVVDEALGLETFGVIKEDKTIVLVAVYDCAKARLNLSFNPEQMTGKGIELIIDKSKSLMKTLYTYKRTAPNFTFKATQRPYQIGEACDFADQIGLPRSDDTTFSHIEADLVKIEFSVPRRRLKILISYKEKEVKVLSIDSKKERIYRFDDLQTEEVRDFIY